MASKPPIDFTAALEQQAWRLETIGGTGRSRAFARGLSVYKLVWVFFVGGVGGVVFETLVRLLSTGDWQRTAGVLYGPFNQVYGLGAVLFALTLYPLRRRSPLVIFAVGTLLGLLFEYLCSWVQEWLFRSASWDYSALPFNLGGRTNLLYGVCWGLLGLLFIHYIWPALSGRVERFRPRPGKIVTLVLAVLLCADMGLSALAVTRWQQRDAGATANSVAARWLDRHYPDTVMKQKYPTLEFKD